MKYLYDVLDTDTGKYVIKNGTSADVERAIGIKSQRIVTYVKSGYKYQWRYLIKIVSAIDTTTEVQMWQNHFAIEWDKARKKVMGGLRNAVKHR